MEVIVKPSDFRKEKIRKSGRTLVLSVLFFMLFVVCLLSMMFWYGG